MEKVEKLAKEIRDFAHNSCGSSYVEDELVKIVDKYAPIEKPFPKHMVSPKGTIVLWGDNKRGVVQKAGIRTTWVLGEVCTGDIFSDFKDCEIQVKP